MKYIDRIILPYDEDRYFSPIRDKIDYVKLIVFSAQNILLKHPAETMDIKCHMKLVIAKMTRLFFYKQDKYFSIAFPFNCIINGDEVTSITSYTGIDIDFKNLSSMISILNNENFRLNPSLMYAYIDAEEEDVEGLSILEEMFRFEPSYIRYDKDPDRVNGKLHPLHHLDVNYSAYGTFKLGLSASIEKERFNDILDLNTDCLFLA